MNRTLFWRLAWKEYRMLRGFWIAIALSTVVLQLMAIVTITLLDESTKDLPANLFGLGLGMAAFYALGCGATLFAVEREEETYDFLRTLPVSGGQAMRAKFAVAVVSIVALWAFVYLESTLVSGLQVPTASHQQFLWGAFGLAAIEALVWGMFFSLVLRRPISAVFAAAATGLAAVGTIVWWVEARPQGLSALDDLEAVTFYRVLVMAVVVAADVWLARHWFDEALFVPTGWVARQRRVARPEERRAWSRWLQSQRTPIARLLWQQWRQSRLTMALMTGIGAAFAVWLAYYIPLPRERVATVLAGVAAVVTVVLTALAGANTFQPDQSKQSFRFLAERGVRPATIWLSRQLIWLAPVALWATATVLVWLAIEDRDWNSIAQELMKDETAVEDAAAQSKRALEILAGMALVVLAMTYAAGQFCSMFLRRGVIAGFFALVLVVVLCWWAGIMDWLGISWLWSVAPIPLVLLVATWLRTPHWLLERTDRTARWRAVLSVALPTVTLVVAVIAFRVYQIPYADPGFSVAEFARPITPEERATAEMYLKAAGMIKLPGAETGAARDAALVAVNGPAIALALEATARPSCSFLDRGLPIYTNPRPLVELGRLLLASARVLETEGQLATAWERYVAALQLSRRLRPAELVANSIEEMVDERIPCWAARSGQSTERIKRANDELQKFYANLPPAADWIKTDYATATRLLEFDPDQWRRTDTTPHELRMLRISTALVPWEMARARRVVNLYAASDLDAIERLEAAFDHGEPNAELLSSIRGEEPPRKLWETTLFHSYGMPSPRGVAEVVVSMQTRRRVTLLLLTLEAWKAEHGKLPETLDELVGVYLKTIPLDPYTGQPFRYATWTSGGRRVNITEGATYPQVPPPARVEHVIWSARPRVGSARVNAAGRALPPLSVDEEAARPAATELERWENGEAYRIP